MLNCLVIDKILHHWAGSEIAAFIRNNVFRTDPRGNSDSYLFLFKIQCGELLFFFRQLFTVVKQYFLHILWYFKMNKAIWNYRLHTTHSKNYCEPAPITVFLLSTPFNLINLFNSNLNLILLFYLFNL